MNDTRESCRLAGNERKDEIMASKRVQTFRRGEILVGAEAREAWAAQIIRCGCGSCGNADAAVSGSCYDMPAEWLGCQNCGNAIGRPLIYRLPSQMGVGGR